MILSTGNNARSRLSRAKGYTFIELMVAISILSIGIVAIYQALLTSLNYQSQLSCRLYALSLIEHKISEIQKVYSLTGVFPSASHGQVEQVVLDHRAVPFRWAIHPVPVVGLDGLMGAEVVLSWPGGNRELNIKRYVFLSDLNMERYKNEQPQ